MTSESYQRFRKWCHERGARLDQPLRLEELDDRSLSLTLTDFAARRAPATQLDSLHSLVQDDAASVQPPAGAAEPASAGDLEHSLASQSPEGAADNRPATVLPAPTTRYEVLHAIAGGMGLCCFCFDHQAGFPFVIKTFRSDRFARSAATLPEFLREVAVWTGLGTHANLVRAYGVRLIQNQPYLFLEFIHGPNLRERIRQMPLAAGDVVELMLQTCRALRHARNCTPGFVHGDLKPSNLLLGPRWLKVTDFGLARSGAETQRGPAGTPAYMAPELWLHQKVSSRTDVYALGVVAWEALTGRRPFDGKTAAEIESAHLAGRMSAWGDGDRELAPLLRACLQRSAAERPGLLELWAELRRLRNRSRLPARLFAAERGPRAQRQRLEFQFEQFRKRGQIGGALEFGEEFGGGVVEAIRSQLEALAELPSGPELTQRLWTLSALHAHCPEAFTDWNAWHLELTAASLRAGPLPGLFAPQVRLLGADLSKAQLRGAFLAGAALAGAQLDHADLRAASLAGADLRDASLRGADLRFATLDGAELAGACFEAARLDGVSLLGSLGASLPTASPPQAEGAFRTRLSPLPHTALAVRWQGGAWELRGSKRLWCHDARTLSPAAARKASTVAELLAWTSTGVWALRGRRGRIQIERNGASEVTVKTRLAWRPVGLFAPDGSRLGLLREDEDRLAVFDSRDGEPAERMRLQESSLPLALAPRGAALALANLQVIPLADAPQALWKLSLLADGCEGYGAQGPSEEQLPPRLPDPAAAARKALERWGHRHQGIVAPAHALAFSPRGRVLAARGLSPDPLHRFGGPWMEAIRVFDEKSGTIAELPDRGVSREAQSAEQDRGFLVFSPDGRWLASYRPPELSLWQPVGSRLLLRKELPGLRCLAFAPGETLRLGCLYDSGKSLLVIEQRS